MSIAEATRAAIPERYIRTGDVARMFGMSSSSTSRMLAQATAAGLLTENRVPGMRPRYRLTQVLVMAAGYGMEPLVELE